MKAFTISLIACIMLIRGAMSHIPAVDVFTVANCDACCTPIGKHNGMADCVGGAAVVMPTDDVDCLMCKGRYIFNPNMICTTILPFAIDDDDVDEAFRICESKKDCIGVMARNCNASPEGVADPHPGRVEQFSLCSSCTSFTPKLATDPDTCVARKSDILAGCDDAPLNPLESLLQDLPPIFGEIFSAVFMNSTAAAAVAAAAVAAPVALAAVAPPPLTMFPPQGLPQPTASGAPAGGSGGGGGGTLPASAITNPAVAADVASLVSGINGGTVLSVFSSNLPGSFAVPRTVPATAILIAEPPIPIISRQSEHSAENHGQQSCKRPIFDVGGKLNATSHKLSPFLDRISKITSVVSNVQSKLGDFKSKAFEKLGISCLFPKLLRPFEPLIQRTKCALGLNEDGFMETPHCDASACLNPNIQDKVITQDRGLPNLDFMVEDMVTTMDECFDDMEKVTYGSRVVAKLVDDQPCDDPKYASMCQEVMNENNVIFEEDCKSSGCVDPSDDPFRSCFGCDNEESREDFYANDYYYNYVDRQTGETFQATAQNRRVVCTTGANGGQRCRLRIDRGMQLRGVSYGRALQFIHSEQYLGDEDVDLIRK